MRLVIIASMNLYSSLIGKQLFADDRWNVVGVVETKRVFRSARSFAGLLLRGRCSLSFLFFKTAETLVYRFLDSSGRAATPALDRIARRRGVPVVATRELNSKATLRLIRQFAPDLIVSISASEPFGSRLRAIPRLGAINVHAARLPRYRGLAPYFWVLFAGEESTGVTVHRIDGGLDTGPIIRQRPVMIATSDTAQSLFLRCSFVAAEELHEAVAAVLEGTADERLQDSGGSYYSWPSRRAVKEFRAQGHSLWKLREFIRAARST